MTQQDSEHPDLDEFLYKLFVATEGRLDVANHAVDLDYARDFLSRIRGKLYNLLPRFDSRTISEARCFEPRKEASKLRAVLVGDTFDRMIGSPVSSNLNLLKAALSERGVSEVVVDDHPSRESVLDNLREVVAKSECGDAVFLYYGGHGFGPGTEVSQHSFTLPEGYDSGLWLGGEAISGRSSAIRGAELAEFVTAIRNRGANIFLFLDTMGIANIG